MQETDGGAEGEGGERAGTPRTVDCTADATAVDLPADFPAPLPEGTVVVHVEEREEERDAESDFEGRTADGQDLIGRWGIRVVSDCDPAATRIGIVVRAG